MCMRTYVLVEEAYVDIPTDTGPLMCAFGMLSTHIKILRLISCVFSAHSISDHDSCSCHARIAIHYWEL